jgi:hypothetical protein
MNAQELRGLIGFGDGISELRDTARILLIHGHSQTLGGHLIPEIYLGYIDEL